MISRFFAWRSSRILETPFSVSYCFNRLKKGLIIDDPSWKRHYSLEIIDLDNSTDTCRLRLRGSMKIPVADVTIQFHAISKVSTHLYLEFEVKPVILLLQLAIEIPVLLMSVALFPCVLIVLPFFWKYNVQAMQKIRAIVFYALEDSFGIVTGDDKPAKRKKSPRS
jgi:hypothetical protein